MNFRTLDLNLLRVFDAVMTERNVTRAADHLAMSQPAVSNALRRLREATNEELFVPTQAGVTPTRQAEELWPVVRTALDGLRTALEPQVFDPRRDERTFTLAMADATAALALPLLVAHIEATQARANLRIIPLATRDPRALLDHGDADVALGFFPELPTALTAESGSAGVRFESLWHCEYVCVMRRDHPLARKKTLTLDDFCAARHLRVSFAGRPRGFVDNALERLGRSRKVGVTVNQFHSAASAVRHSDLLTVLPRSFVPATGFGDALTCRALPFELAAIDVAMVWHRRHASDPGHGWLREALKQCASTLQMQVAPAAAAQSISTSPPRPSRRLVAASASA
ncbi:MAG: LysR family transcriptional regulator [Burkholderiaceae bacterium]|nr:LysR family transcriptional regulator [Burkholderiaceae bacterium]